MEKLREIEASLKELHEDFNKQVASLSTDTKEFHNSLIDLTAKYPEHRELIQFIVLVNDKLETNNHLFGEIVVEAFNDLVDSKRALVREMLVQKPKQSCMKILSSKIKFSDVKFVLMVLAVIAVSLVIIFDGTFLIKVLSIFGKMGGV